MKFRAIIHGEQWRYLAAIIDARMLPILFFFLLGFYPFLKISSADFFDRNFFKIAVRIQNQSFDVAPGFVRVDVPADEMRRFQHDPASAGQMMAFLSQLQASSMRGAALVLHEALWTNYRINDLLEHAYPATSAIEPDTFKILAGAMSGFRSLLVNNHILQVHVERGMSPEDSLVAQLRMQLKASQTFYSSPIETGATEVLQMESGLLEKPLFWKSTTTTVRPDARLALFMLQQKVRNPEWQQGQGIKIQDQLLKTAASAMVIPYFSVDSGFSVPEKNRYPLAGLLDQKALPVLQDKIVVIGVAGDVDADDLLLNVCSLEKASYAILFPSFIWLHLVIITILLVYLLCIAYMPLRISAIISLLWLLGLFLAQQIVFIAHQQWIPISQWFLFLIFGHLVMFLSCVRRSFYSVEDVSSSDKPVIRQESLPVKKNRWRGFFSFDQKQKPVRIQPTLAGATSLVDMDEADTLQKTVLKRTMPAGQPRPAAVARPGGMRTHLGRYRIERELGRGAMGVVYLGFDPKISRKVAIKTLHYSQFDMQELPVVKERFLREAEAAGKLRHANIVTVYDTGEESDLAYIAMDYVSGNSLSSYIRKDTLLKVEMVYWIMAQVASAVHEANSYGIIHRDIKPSNILFDEKTNEVKVADFGIARIMDGASTRTKTGDLLGSPLYMSPEQIRGEHVGCQSDIFSLGVTFYQLLTGELPFKADNIANLSYQIVQCKFRPVDEVRSGLPVSARRIVAKALQKNPESRYATAGEMFDAISDAYKKDFPLTR